MPSIVDFPFKEGPAAAGSMVIRQPPAVSFLRSCLARAAHTRMGIKAGALQFNVEQLWRAILAPELPLVRPALKLNFFLCPVLLLAPSSHRCYNQLVPQTSSQQMLPRNPTYNRHPERPSFFSLWNLLQLRFCSWSTAAIMLGAWTQSQHQGWQIKGRQRSVPEEQYQPATETTQFYR